MKKEIQKLAAIALASMMCVSCALPIYANQNYGESNEIQSLQSTVQIEDEDLGVVNETKVSATATPQPTTAPMSEDETAIDEATPGEIELPTATPQPTVVPEEPVESVVEEGTSVEDTLPTETPETTVEEFEGGEYIAQGTCGETLSWKLSNDGTMEISGSGAMYNFSAGYWDEPLPANPWQNYKSNIVSVVVQDGCTTIGKSAFSSCSKLKNVQLPDSVEKIEESAFNYCSNLSDIDMGGTQSIGAWAFYGCGFETLNIGEQVVFIGEMAFGNLKNLKSIHVPDSVEEIADRAFAYCYELNSVHLGANLKSLGIDVFLGASKLQTITVSEANSHYRMDGSALLKKEEGSEWETLELYLSNSPETEYSVPDTVTRIGNSAFANCAQLKEVHLSDNVVEVGNSAFANCSALESIYLGTNLKTLEKYALFGTNKLVNLELSPENSNFRKDGGALIQTSDGTNGEAIVFYLPSDPATQYVVPDTVTTIAYAAFANNQNLKEVSIPSTVNKIEAEAFRNSPNLMDVSIDTEAKIEEIPLFAFVSCSNLSKVDLPQSVTKIGSYSFAYTALQELPISSSVTSIQSWAFAGSDLTSITIPSTVKEIDAFAFARCESLQDATVYATIEAIPQGMFDSCSNIKSVSWGRKLEEIGDSAFWGTNIQQINYAGSQESWNNIQIGNYNDPLQSATVVCDWLPPGGVNTDIYETDGNLVLDVQVGSTVEEIKQAFTSQQELVVLDANGNDITSDATASIGTGCRVGTISSDVNVDDDWKVIVIYGDLDSDGKIKSTDLLQLRRYMLLIDDISQKPICYTQAATPISKDEKQPKSVDLLQMRRYLLKIEQSMTK